MDRSYIDYQRPYLFTLCCAFFVVRAKEMFYSNGAIRTRWTRVRGTFRSHRHPNRHGVGQSVSGCLAASKLLRRRNQQASEVPDQQLHPSRTYDRLDLPLPLAGGTLFRELDMAHSFVCYGISRANCAESTVSGVAGCVHSAMHRSTSALRMIQGAPAQACVAGIRRSNRSMVVLNSTTSCRSRAFSSTNDSMRPD